MEILHLKEILSKHQRLQHTEASQLHTKEACVLCHTGSVNTALLCAHSLNGFKW